MHRARNHLKNLKDLGEHEFSFIVMDEIFSSTNPEEGISGGYAIAKKLGEFPNSVTLLTTHFNYLTKLEEKTGNYKAYKIPIKRENDRIVYPYKLSEGVSDQFIALELLKHKGFDEDIISNAVNICSAIQKDRSETRSIETESPDPDFYDESDGCKTEDSAQEASVESSPESGNSSSDSPSNKLEDISSERMSIE